MEKVWGFDTEPKSAKKYAIPNLPTREGALVLAGSSTFGSHAVGLALSCLRALGLKMGVPRSPPSRQDGSVELIADPGGILVQGPFEEGRTFDLAQSMWMIRGTLIHVALAHELSHLALAKDGQVVIGGHLYTKAEDLYTAAEAVEAAAGVVGLQARTYALPAARKMLPMVTSWAKDFVAREVVLGVESQLAWHVRGPWTYTARMDLISQNRVSKLVRAWDYKTATRPEQEKKRYAVSGQLHGQDRLGHLWARDLWAGVVVLLIEDVGETSTSTGTIQEWALPHSPMGGTLESAIVRAEEGLAPWVSSPAMSWPANPFACSSCSERQRCFGSSLSS